MKKIAIMTWYQHKNYGTILQATALIKVLESLGFYAEGIDYISKGYDRQNTLDKLLSLNKIQAGIKNNYISRKYKLIKDEIKEKNFDNFINENIKFTEKVQTSSQLFNLNKVYDAFICGSDQIWTPNAYNSKYYLDFVEDNNKKIAYAPSFGQSQISNKYIRDDIGKQLSSFGSLSIRENQGKNMIKKYYNLEAELVLDPTLLLESSNWNLLKKDYMIKPKTLLCYMLGDNENYWKNIELIASEKGLSISIIPVRSKDYYRNYEILKGVGPGEFLSLFDQAEFVCTDSFHGTIFSILYKKEFVTFKRFKDNDKASQNSRIISLLENLNLTERLFNNSFNFSSIDWNEVYRNKNKFKEQSMIYLKKALKKAEISNNVFNKVITNTCCGCGICAYVCPTKAIQMKEIEGFYQAVVDNSKCINCNMCTKVCSFNESRGKSIDEAKLYEAKSSSMKTLNTSTSGGISHELLKHFSLKGYPVYGCIYDKNDGGIKHKLMSDFDENILKLYQGSKYLQSKFFDNLDILNSEKAVIAGTPCQIASVDNYLRLKNKRNNFILVDLVCHGVPSRYLWNRYLKEKEINKHELEKVYFRDPSKGWKNKSITLQTNNKKITTEETKDLFYHFFDMQLCYMNSCYECNFRTSSKADLRLGDFWGKKYTERDLKYGVSMVVCFTKKGETVLRQLEQSNKIEIVKEWDMNAYYKGQGPVNPIIPLCRTEVLKELKESDHSLKSIIKNHAYKLYIYKKLQRFYLDVKRKIRK